jgi:uncharacterized protein (TIGR03083 family)
MVRDERADLARFPASLSPQQWQVPTLCQSWRVRDVVAHVISYDDLSARELLARAIQGRLRSGRINAIVMAPYATHTPTAAGPAQRPPEPPRAAGLAAGTYLLASFPRRLATRSLISSRIGRISCSVLPAGSASSQSS